MQCKLFQSCVQGQPTNWGSKAGDKLIHEPDMVERSLHKGDKPKSALACAAQSASMFDRTQKLPSLRACLNRLQSCLSKFGRGLPSC